MCGRYYIAEDDQAEELKQIIDMINRKHNGDGSVKTAGEIFPSERVPVITTSRAQKIIPFPMLMYGKVSQENYVELTAASAIPNKEIKSPQILRY